MTPGKQLRILIDAHMVGERESGNERYIVNLIKALRDLSLPADFFVAASCPEQVESLIQGKAGWNVVPVASSGWHRLGWQLAGLASTIQPDVLHVTYAGPLWCNCPVVTTIHDVSYLSHPEWFSLRDRLVLRVGVGLTIARGCRVITISDFSRSEIERLYKLHPGSVDAIPIAGDPCFAKSRGTPDAVTCLHRLGINDRYLLAVGDLQPRKNLIGLIRSVAYLKGRFGRNGKLVVVGKRKLNDNDVQKAVQDCGLASDVIFTGYVSDEDLVYLYGNAEVFVYPSHYEGFGLPVLEAMACGTPVVTSNVASLPEVAGDAARLVDPNDTEELALAINEVEMDAELRDSMREKGLSRAQDFSWRQTAMRTWEVYMRAAGVS